MTNIPTNIAASDIENYVEHGYADNNGVNIHYASLGSGPLIVMIHGFPDYWYTWRNQMVALAPHYQAVAFDLRDYNLSDKPKGAENYAMPPLLSCQHMSYKRFLPLQGEFGQKTGRSQGLSGEVFARGHILRSACRDQCITSFRQQTTPKGVEMWVTTFQLGNRHKDVIHRSLQYIARLPKTYL